ncbi:MAG: metal-dependent transcriptional regulator [SAR202 cluster bacterium]|nr:metal-dependent transcriptional regulator [SAR202 cluster bacterium]
MVSTKKPTAVERRLSMAAENYLLSIFQLREQGNSVTPSQLADQLKQLPLGEGLGTSLPSVSGMLRRLSREGLITLNKAKEIELTEEGQTEAETMVRRHRLAELLVVDVLGVELSQSHEEAHRLEHAISPELESKIREKLGNPGKSPFGDPIPGSGYTVPEDSFLLSDAIAGDTIEIDRIPEDDRALLEYLIPRGIIPGSSASVLETAVHIGIIKLNAQGEEVILGHKVGERIWVRKSGKLG